MIYADLKCKTNVPEDVFTSNCIGSLSYLPDHYLIEFLSTAINTEGNSVNLSKYNRIEKIKYWPWLNEGGQPDLLCVLSNTEASDRIHIVIEVKHGSGKSSYAETNDSCSDIAQGHRDYISNDQLAKYWKSANKVYGDAILIYLTHHRCMPIQDLLDSIKETDGHARIYWSSWFNLYHWITEKLKMNSIGLTDSRILNTLKNYLTAKRYVRFENLNDLLIKILECNNIVDRYHRTYHTRCLSSCLKNKIYSKKYCRAPFTSKNADIFYER